MALLQATYPIAPKGLATNFEETALPPDYALKFRNRFINSAGGCEKRQGLVKHSAAIPGAPTVTSLHELVDSRTGATTLLAGAEGRLYRYNTITSAWVSAHNSHFHDVTYQSVQMVDRLIFVNGTNRNVYTKDGVTFTELRAIIDEDQAISPTSPTQLVISNTTALGGDLNQRGVAPDDVVFNLTRQLLGIISIVGSATATHTGIAGQSPGDHYQIIDTVELNIIPQDGGGEDDNVAIAGPGTNSTTVFVSGITNWLGTSIRVGDFIQNTTRLSVSLVSAISSAALGIGGVVAGQTAGDSLTFHKSAMPLAERVHVHYGRAYFIDSRDRHLVRISGPDDPSDMTTSSGTIASGTFSFGSQQPTGDIIKSMASYQRFLVMCGNRFTLLFEGTDPIIDDAGGTKDFSPAGLFPQGARSPQGLATIGNDVVIISDDGVQSFSYLPQSGGSGLGQENLSEALKNTLRTLIAAANESDVLVFHYPKRSWVCFKIGSQIFTYNYTPYFGTALMGASPQAAFSPTPTRGSWSLFDGKFARQNAFLTRQDGTLLCGGAGGQVYRFDAGTYDDDGETYTTEYQSGWLTLDEPRRSLQIKQGHYIQPTFHNGAPITYTIRAEAPFFPIESNDIITVSAAGGSGSVGGSIIGQWTIGGASGIFDQKFPLRWRGKEMRLTISTSDQLGPDVVSRFTLFINRLGIR